VEAAAGDRVQAFVPYTRLRDVAALPGVRRVREPWRATTKAMVTEGLDPVVTGEWRAAALDGDRLRPRHTPALAAPAGATGMNNNRRDRSCPAAT